MSVGITPRFAYNAGLGIVDFTPSLPPNKKTPFAPLEAIRHDSITSTGLKQSVLERIDVMTVLAFDNVPESDMASWQAFFQWTLAGNQFTYYPDSTVEAVSVEYTLEDMDWTPKWVSLQNYSFTMKMRTYVGGSEHFS